MKIELIEPMSPHLEAICQRHMSNLENFIRELRGAGVDPSPKYFGEGSNSLTVIAGGIPVTIGKAEYSEANKIKLRKLARLESLYETDEDLY